MYAVLGWINVAIFVILLLPFILRKVNQLIYKNKNKAISTFLKSLRKVHKALGLVLVFSSALHGYLALGAVRLHTGSLLFLSLLVTASLGGAFYRLKKRRLFFYHRVFIALSALLLVIHLLFPALLYQLLN